MSNALNHWHLEQPGSLGMYSETLMLSALGVGGIDRQKPPVFPEAHTVVCSWNSEGLPAALFHSDLLSTASLLTEQPSSQVQGALPCSCTSAVVLEYQKGKDCINLRGKQFYRVGFR